MTEQRKGGFKEFVFLILWLIALAAAYDFTDTFIRTFRNTGAKPGQNLFLTVAVIICGCILIYLALKHYAAGFTYELTEKSIKISRKIGHRVKSEEIKNKQIRAFSKTRPNSGKIHSMKTTIVSDKHTYYLTYINGGALETIAFEPSESMAEEILKRVKEG